MGALTANLSLYLPGGGSLLIGGSDEVADIDKLNQNFQTIDSALAGVTIVSLAPLFVAGTPTQTPQSIKQNGWIQFQGSWQMAAGTNPVTPAIAYNTYVTLFTLPVGHRPSRPLMFPSGNTSSVLMQSAVMVAPNGTVEVFVNNNGGGTTTSYFSLSGVRFRHA